MNNTRCLFPGVLLASLLVLAGTCLASDKNDHFGWLFGTWSMTADEDHSPPDSLTSCANGTVPACDDQRKEQTNACFVRKGMVFLVIPQAKGLVALALVPDVGKSTLTFTSPRPARRTVLIASDRGAAPSAKQSAIHSIRGAVRFGTLKLSGFYSKESHLVA
jgi:hypothetical protein